MGSVEGKSFKFTHILRHYSKNGSGPRFAPRLKGKTDTQLLSSKVFGLYIGFQPIGLNFFHKLSNICLDFRKKLPKFLGTKRFVHACLFVQTEETINNDDCPGILVEFGAYSKGYDSYSHEVFFLEEDGLRFTEMTLNEFKASMEQDIKEINENQKNKNVPYIKCKVNSFNVFYQLLHRAIFGNLFVNQPELIIYRQLHDEKFRKKYTADNYRIIRNNCQTFVAKMIESSYATIVATNNEFTDLISESKIDYNNLYLFCPQNIVEILEKNEKLVSERIRRREQRIIEDNVSLYNNINYEHFFTYLDAFFAQRENS